MRQSKLAEYVAGITYKNLQWNRRISSGQPGITGYRSNLHRSTSRVTIIVSRGVLNVSIHQESLTSPYTNTELVQIDPVHWRRGFLHKSGSRGRQVSRIKIPNFLIGMTYNVLNRQHAMSATSRVTVCTKTITYGILQQEQIHQSVMF